MGNEYWQWTPGLGAAAGALLMFALIYMSWQRLATQREKARRIAAARVRSGHVPLEIPTLRSSLSTVSSDAPDTHTGWSSHIDHGMVTVDEQPRIHISYTESNGKLAERVIKVEQLDLHRRLIVARGDFADDDVRIVPLDRIRQARNADSGQPFGLGTWVDAVRVARRRRSGFRHVDEDAMPTA